MRAFVIRCPIHGSIKLDKLEVDILSHKFCQRLRYVSQLGFAHYVYPSANHNRLSHSLGVLHLAGKLYNHLAYEATLCLNKFIPLAKLTYYRKILRLAALLHDIGHLPFSHTLEDSSPSYKEVREISRLIPYKTNPDKIIMHEDISAILIMQLSQEGYFSKVEALDIISLIKGDFSVAKSSELKDPHFNVYPLLSAMINSDLDVDRMDYLLRDSYHSGVSYGRFDMHQLMRCYEILGDQKGGKFSLALHVGGFLAFEDMLLGRRLMFIQVYFHKTLLNFSKILQSARQAKEIKLSIWDNIDSYLENTDWSLFALIQKNRNKFWCGKIYSREAPKVLSRVINKDDNKATNQIKEIRDKLDKAKIIHLKGDVGVKFFDYKGLDKDSIKLISYDLEDKQASDLVNHLNHHPDKLEISQVSVFKEDYQKALKIIKG
ncbi:MAG: HD domain-containing protein [SAR324 cluster bacterium]|nr:HD domain-containing protein [SAR324 cluster bacterium]